MNTDTRFCFTHLLSVYVEYVGCADAYTDDVRAPSSPPAYYDEYGDCEDCDYDSHCCCCDRVRCCSYAHLQ